MSPTVISQETATDIAESRKIEPLEEFGGDTTAPWHVRCKLCGQEFYSSYRKLRSAKLIGCRECSIADTAKKRAYKATFMSLQKAGWELLTTASEYRTQFELARVRHQKCEREIDYEPHLLKNKLCECEHEERFAQRRREGEVVAASRNGRLLDTWYENSRQWGSWCCEKGHIWKTHWYSVVGRQKTWCPFCSGREAIIGVNDLATVNPVLAQTFDSAKNDPLRPDGILPNSHLKVWWLCSKGHSFDAIVSNRHLLGTACPFCSNHKVLAGYNDLMSREPDVARYWHPTKNKELPNQVTRTANKKVWWLCEQQHETHSHIPTKVNARGACSTCIGRTVQTGFNDLATLRPDVARLWHPTKNKGLTPGDVTPASNQRVWWLCDVGHDWQKDISGRSQGRGCPYCAYKKCWSGFNDLATTHPYLLEEWDYEKNVVDPTKIIAGGEHLVAWICGTHGQYDALTVARAFGNQSGCPSCSESGYRPYYRGLLYFIEHRKLGARKIGITNTHKNKRRLEAFRAAGWDVVATWEHDEGLVAKLTERAVLFSWIRQELLLPPFLDRSQMSNLNGQTETFSMDGPTNGEVFQRCDAFFGKFRQIAEKDIEGLSLLER